MKAIYIYMMVCFCTSAYSKGCGYLFNKPGTVNLQKYTKLIALEMGAKKIYPKLKEVFNKSFREAQMSFPLGFEAPRANLVLLFSTRLIKSEFHDYFSKIGSEKILFKEDRLTEYEKFFKEFVELHYDYYEAFRKKAVSIEKKKNSGFKYEAWVYDETFFNKYYEVYLIGKIFEENNNITMEVVAPYLDGLYQGEKKIKRYSQYVYADYLLRQGLEAISTGEEIQKILLKKRSFLNDWFKRDNKDIKIYGLKLSRIKELIESDKFFQQLSLSHKNNLLDEIKRKYQETKDQDLDKLIKKLELKIFLENRYN